MRVVTVALVSSRAECACPRVTPNRSYSTCAPSCWGPHRVLTHGVASKRFPSSSWQISIVEVPIVQECTNGMRANTRIILEA